MNLSDVLGISREQAWRDEALCAQADPDEWWPDKGGSSRAAKGICGRCTAQPACLEYALRTNEHYGIWGGMTEHERLAEKKRRRLAGLGESA